MLAVAREHTVAGWAALEAELDAWSASGARATFWWRDDDATCPGPRLEQLLSIAGATPVALAVIPAQATPELARRVETAANITVVQHGFAHLNHAPGTAKKAEFGDHRPLAEMRADLQAGRARLAALFGARFAPIFVPPWNRYGSALGGELAAQGFKGLSAFGRRTREPPVPEQHCHVDIVDWRGSRGFVGTDAAIGYLVTHLRMRRTGAADASEPTGLLTHHRDHDAACWRFIADFVKTVETHGAAVWQQPARQIAIAPR